MNELNLQAIPSGACRMAGGAVELGDTYGQAQSGSLSHLVDEEDVLDALGNVQAVVQRMEREEFSAEVVFDETSPDPVLGDLLTHPISANKGIIQSAEWNWTNGGTKSFSITSRHLMSLGNEPARSYVTLAE